MSNNVSGKKCSNIAIARPSNNEKSNHISTDLKKAGASGLDFVSFQKLYNESGLSFEEGHRLSEDKEMLLLQLHEQMIDYIIDNFIEISRRDISVPDKLTLFSEILVAQAADKKSFLAVVFREYQHLEDPHVKNTIRVKRKKVEEIVIAVFKQGIEEGFIVDEDPAYLAMAFFGMMNWTYVWYRKGCDKQNISELFFKIFSKGIVKSRNC